MGSLTNRVQYIDDYSKEVIGQLTDVGISGSMVARYLSQFIQQRETTPHQIVCDNGPEFTGKAMFFWSREHKINLAFIQPGKPTQNAFVESFNGKFRNECLNQNWFKDLAEARRIIDDYRHHFNNKRPHSSLRYKSPIDFLRGVA